MDDEVRLALTQLRDWSASGLLPPTPPQSCTARFGRILVLFIQEDEDLVEAFQPRLVLDGLCYAELEAVRDTVTGDQVLYLSAKLRLNIVSFPRFMLALRHEGNVNKYNYHC